MRYTRLDVEGRTGHSATFKRRPGAEHIEIEVLTPDLTRTHHVLADSREDRWSMAQCLQDVLDGGPSMGGGVQVYASAIELLAD